MKPDVPEEIVLEILSKLPLRPLSRFKCVSKRWRFLISDPKFNVSVQRQSVIVVSGNDRRDFSFHCLNSDGSVVEISRPKPLQFPESVRLNGSCNGLLLVNQGENFFIWNPLTGFCNKVLLHERYGVSERYFSVPGLCYDSSTDDYNIIILNRLLDFCMVGSFRNNSWTKIHCPYTPTSKKILPGPIVNEHLHWLVTKSSFGEDRSSQAHRIVYFVPQKNEFVKVPMPECDDRTRKEISILCLGVLNGCLSLAQLTNNIAYYNIVVLVMKKYGEKESWTSLFVIIEFPSLYGIDSLVPLCCIKDMVLLWHGGSETNEILAYDLNKKTNWNFKVPHKGLYGLYMDAAIFVESLVSPPSWYG